MYTQCTIRGPFGSPQESHLISSSLHVINLPAQCYCRTGHSSSFSERGIDQARTASVVHLCAVSQQQRMNKIVQCIKHIPCFSSPLCVFICICVRICLLNVRVCSSERGGQKTSSLTNVCLFMFSYFPLSWLVSILMSCGLIQGAIMSIYYQCILS